MNNLKVKIMIKLFSLVFLSGALFIVIIPLFSQEEDVGLFKRPALIYGSGDLKDPFDSALPKPERPVQIKQLSAAAGTPVAPLPTFDVQGILWGGPLPQAVIEGQVLKVGDVIKDAEITEISKEGIKLRYNKREYKILPPSSVTSNTPNQ